MSKCSCHLCIFTNGNVEFCLLLIHFYLLFIFFFFHFLGRFLDPHSKSRSYLPFGLGHRVCVGSTLAKMEIFMFCAYLVKNFVFSSPDGEPLPDTTGRSGLTIRPKPFKICLKKRLWCEKPALLSTSLHTDSYKYLYVGLY